MTLTCMEEQPCDRQSNPKPRFECIFFSIADEGSAEPGKATKKAKKAPAVSVDLAEDIATAGDGAKLIQKIAKLEKNGSDAARLARPKKKLQKKPQSTSMLRDGSLKRPSAAAGE